MDFDLPEIPEIARGSVIPEKMQLLWLKEAKEREMIRQQRRHDFLIATYGIIGGIAGGVISSVIVLKLQGLL